MLRKMKLVLVLLMGPLLVYVLSHQIYLYLETRVSVISSANLVGKQLTVARWELERHLEDTPLEEHYLSDDIDIRPTDIRNNSESSDSNEEQTLSNSVSSLDHLDKAAEYVAGRYNGTGSILSVRTLKKYNSGNNVKDRKDSVLTGILPGNDSLNVLQTSRTVGPEIETTVQNNNLHSEYRNHTSSVTLPDVTKSSLARDPSHCSDSPCSCHCVEGAWTNRTLESTCSDYATSRGPGQKVVSFCFYGNIHHRRQYFQGILRNAEAVKKWCPGWTMRVYVDVSPSNKNVSQMLCQLQCQHSHLDICHMENIPGYGSLIGTQQNTWRFLPMADPLVDLFVSRDLDSRLSQREVDAVQEWIKSGLPFHVMRDHYLHGSLILAGMWGARVQGNRVLMQELLTKMLNRGNHIGRKGLDQVILANVVWPNIKGMVLQHDSYFCTRFSYHGNMTPWPSRRLQGETYNFVGARVDIDTVPISKACPVACRPRNHRDWYTC